MVSARFVFSSFHSGWIADTKTENSDPRLRSIFACNIISAVFICMCDPSLIRLTNFSRVS